MKPKQLPLASAMIAALLVTAPAPALADPAGWNRASNIARDVVVLGALGMPAVRGDWTGLKQSAFSMGAAAGATTLLKHSIHETRPDDSNDKSFPSGHTSISFAAAASLEKRYGWQVGLPAHAIAAFVGVARVEAKKHYWHDVAAGAALGEASGWLLTKRHDDKVQWLPWADRHGAGVELGMAF